MNRKKIRFFPPNSKNQYVTNMIQAIEIATESKVMPLDRISTLLKSPTKLFNRSDIVIVNWLENYLLNNKNRLSFVGIFIYFFYLTYLKVSSKKVIYIRHNIHPHNMTGVSAKLAKKITDFGESFCDLKASHSGHMTKDGYEYLPHPLYELNNVKRNIDDEKYYLMFGRIDRYKRFENIINAWNLDTKLIIAGSTKDVDYVDELKALIKNKNIELNANYIPDSEAELLVANSQAIILAHSDKDMIVSGSFFYAITLGIPVYSIESLFFNWLKQEKKFIGLYTFSNAKEIVSKLEKPKKVSREEIITHSEKLFGKKALQETWKELLEVCP